MQDLLSGNLTDNFTQNWTEEMKETHKKVTEDYQSGKLKFSDIDLTKIVEMSWKAVNKALSKFGKDLE